MQENGNTKYAIDKMALSFDKTIDVLKDFLKTLGDIIAKLELARVTQESLLERLDSVADNTFKIISNMEKASNDKIISILEDFEKEVQKINHLCSDISYIKETKEERVGYNAKLDIIMDKVSSSHKIYRVIAGLLGFIAIALSGLKIYDSMQTTDKLKNIDKVVEFIENKVVEIEKAKVKK